MGVFGVMAFGSLWVTGMSYLIIIIPEFLAIVFLKLWPTASVGDVNLVFEGYDNIIL